MLAQVCHSLCFRLAATVGEEDERDAVGLKVTEGLRGARERLGAAEENAIDAGRFQLRENSVAIGDLLKCEGKVCSNWGFPAGSLEQPSAMFWRQSVPDTDRGWSRKP